MAALTISSPWNQALTLEVVERKMSRVDAGVTFAQGMSHLFRFLFATVHVTGALNTAVKVQADLINSLAGEQCLHLDQAQMMTLAEKIEHLVKINHHILNCACPLKNPFWSDYLESLGDQAEHLTSIAETYRMACDDESLEILAVLASNVADMRLEHAFGPVHA